jgi:hypothetical protein
MTLLAIRFGRLDVEAMMREMSPQLLLFWEAAVDLGLVPDPWLQTGKIIAAIRNTATQLSPGDGFQRIFPPEYYVPGFRGHDPDELLHPGDSLKAAETEARQRDLEQGDA